MILRNGREYSEWEWDSLSLKVKVKREKVCKGVWSTCTDRRSLPWVMDTMPGSLYYTEGRFRFDRSKFIRPGRGQ